MSGCALHDAFLTDHQTLMQGLEEIRAAVDHDDVGRAVDAARRLDHDAGPHVAFEEACLLPAMEREYGAEFVAHLAGEHAVGQRALRTLVALENRRHFTAEERRSLTRQLTAALDHGFSIGTLLSHVDALDPPVQERLQACLAAQRRRAPRWLDWPPDAAAEPPGEE